MERSDNAAFEDAEIIFNRIGMEIAAEAHILISGVIDGSVICESCPDAWVDCAFVRRPVGCYLPFVPTMAR
jgi:hypothetical protein